MTYEGRLRETMHRRDDWRDSAVYVYSILAHEWRAGAIEPRGGEFHISQPGSARREVCHFLC